MKVYQKMTKWPPHFYFTKIKVSFSFYLLPSIIIKNHLTQKCFYLPIIFISYFLHSPSKIKPYTYLPWFIAFRFKWPSLPYFDNLQLTLPEIKNFISIEMIFRNSTYVRKWFITTKFYSNNNQNRVLQHDYLTSF